MDNGELPLSEKEFSRVRERVYKIAGISLSDAKRTLVVSRLSKIIRAMGLTSFDGYLDHLDQKGRPEDDQAFVNALTTNLTRFFREDHHFDHLNTHIADLIKSPGRATPGGKPRLRIWSAGCSTGQEPYTIAVNLLHAFPELKRWDFRILATDIDSNVVAKAAKGIYPDTEFAGLPASRMALFERAGPGEMRIPRAAHELVTFKLLNLIEPWPVKGPFDAIFCRNVAIYFDKPTQGQLFDRLGEVLAPDGFLYIGHSENLQAVSSGFRLVGKTVYQRKTHIDSKESAA